MDGAIDPKAVEQAKDALRHVIEQIETGEQPWWISVPERGGFDVPKIEAALKALEQNAPQPIE